MNPSKYASTRKHIKIKDYDSDRKQSTSPSKLTKIQTHNHLRKHQKLKKTKK